MRIIETNTYTQLSSLVVIFDGTDCLEQWLDFIEQLDAGLGELHAISWTGHHCEIALISSADMNSNAAHELMDDALLVLKDGWSRMFIMDTEGGQYASD